MQDLAALNRLHQAMTGDGAGSFLGTLCAETQCLLEETEGVLAFGSRTRLLLQLLDQGLVMASNLVEAYEGYRAVLGAVMEEPQVAAGSEPPLALTESLADLGDKVDTLKHAGTELLLCRAQIQQRLPN